MDWSNLYPKQYDISKVEIADIGCGYGGLMIKLGPQPEIIDFRVGN